MKKQIILCIGITILFLGACITSSIAIDNPITPINSGNTLYVGGTGPSNYTKIQDAIDNASDGDVIFVFNGTYQEKTIKIEKTIKLLGEDRNTTILDGEFSEGIIVTIKSRDVTISGFTFQKCYQDGFGEAICIWNKTYSLENIIISDCVIKECDRGIYYVDVDNLVITNCDFNDNDGQVTWGTSSSNIKISKCLSHNNGVDLGGYTIIPGAFYFDDVCSDVKIYNCTLYYNIGFSIFFTEGYNFEIYHNHIYQNSWYGILVCRFGEMLKNIDIHDNHIHNNYHSGLNVEYVTEPGINIFNNNISRNGHSDNIFRNGGIIIKGSNECVTIKNNNIFSNDGFGIYTVSSGILIMENNISKNSKQGVYSKKEFIDITRNIITHNMEGINLNNEFDNVSENIISDNEIGINISRNYNNIFSNIISNNEIGIYISGEYNKIFRNEISNNNEGIKLYGEIYPLNGNNISYNNFLKNNNEVFFKFINPEKFRIHTFNYFNQNYWNRKRVFPKPIVGITEWLGFNFPKFYFDWNPAKVPYDIGI